MLRLLCLLWLLPLSARADEPRHGLSMLSELKYPEGFARFEYVRADAPKGGVLRLPIPGTYDSFNSVVQKGRPAEGTNFLGAQAPLLLLYDRLLEPAADEATSAYGRLAESVAVAADGSSVTFRLREHAYWHDGKELTVDDVVFSFETYKKHGSAVVKTMLKDVERIERTGERDVRYVMARTSFRNPSIPLTLGSLVVLPKHYWQDKDISRTTVKPPLGSGPYRIRDFEIGRYVRYERVPNYWGRDLPVNVGRYNFNQVKFDYFRDEHAMFEAHKADAVDMRPESVSKVWATEYDFPAVRAGLFKKEMMRLARPAGLYWPVFWNMRVPRFADVRVREALYLLYDFEWLNRVLLYGFYEHGSSLFYNSEMAHTGLPSQAELALLEPFRAQLPPRVFGAEFRPLATAGATSRREHMLRAIELFRQAGWQIRAGRLVHEKTGERFRIDFVLSGPTIQRALMPYVDALRRVGIETSMRVPEVSNWLYRVRTGAFDASASLYPPSETPGLELRTRFSSATAGVPFGLNWGAIKNPVLDALITKAITARTRADLLAATRAFDRVFLWNFYIVPGMASPHYRYAYWDRFGRPEVRAPLTRPAALDTWWWDQQKAQRVERGMAQLGGGAKN